MWFCSFFPSILQFFSLLYSPFVFTISSQMSKSSTTIVISTSPPPSYMSSTLTWTLPIDLGLQPLYLSFWLLLLEQALLVSAVMKLLIFLAKLEAVAVFTIVPHYYFTLEHEPHCLSYFLISLHLFYFLSNFYSS